MHVVDEDDEARTQAVSNDVISKPALRGVADAQICLRRTTSAANVADDPSSDN